MKLVLTSVLVVGIVACGGRSPAPSPAPAPEPAIANVAEPTEPAASTLVLGEATVTEVINARHEPSSKVVLRLHADGAIEFDHGMTGALSAEGQLSFDDARKNERVSYAAITPDAVTFAPELGAKLSPIAIDGNTVTVDVDGFGPIAVELADDGAVTVHHVQGGSRVQWRVAGETAAIRRTAFLAFSPMIEQTID
jgi:hypothetical protein